MKKRNVCSISKFITQFFYFAMYESIFFFTTQTKQHRSVVIISNTLSMPSMFTLYYMIVTHSNCTEFWQLDVFLTQLSQLCRLSKLHMHSSVSVTCVLNPMCCNCAGCQSSTCIALCQWHVFLTQCVATVHVLGAPHAWLCVSDMCS